MKKIPVGTVSKSNWKIVGRGKINTPNTHTWPLTHKCMTSSTHTWPLTHIYMTTHFPGYVQGLQ